MNPRLISPWIDLDTLSSPELSFWYHGYGISMGDFDVYVQSLGGTWSALWDTSGSHMVGKMLHGQKRLFLCHRMLVIRAYTF